MKLFKKFAVVFAAIVAIFALAAFAACTDKPDNGDDGGDVVYATTEFTITIKYEDGTTIDGTKHRDGGSWMNDADTTSPVTNVRIQYCAVFADGSLGSCANPVVVNENGQAVISVSDVKSFVESVNAVKFELHIMHVSSYGYTKGEDNSAYGRYEIDKIPVDLTVTLKLASEVA